MSYMQNQRVIIRPWSLLVSVTLALVVLGVTYLFFYPTTSGSLVESEYQQEAIIREAQTEWVPELPVRLIIPAIEVDAEIQYVGLDSSGSGEMDVPSNFTDVGWYKHGVRPGMKGSAVMTGHLNGKNIPEAVFFNLADLQIGDEVVIMSAERIEDIFRVVRIEIYAHDAPTEEVFVSTDGKKRLNLITCGGEWLSAENQYEQRTVVFTELLTDVE